LAGEQLLGIMQQNGGRVGVAEMREDEIVRLSLRCARLAVIGAPYESVLADGVADIMRTDAGTGVTNWNGSGDDPLAAVQVVVSGAPPFTREQAQAALAVVARHPTFVGADPFRWPTHRVSDVVSLPAFWETDVWRLMHGHGNGRYPAAVMLVRHPSETVFVGVHRSRHDFDADDMTTLDLLREPLAAALTFRTAWRAAIARTRAAIDTPLFDPLTHREEQIIGLIALGWTNARIGRHLRITERTVRKHVENLNDKLGATNRAAIVHRWHTGVLGPVPVSFASMPGS
jgi:DNA-binding CsgD family transcriptional regulator